MTAPPPQLTADAKSIEAFLEKLFTDMESAGADATPADLLAAMRHATLGGGKRIRGALVMGAARLGYDVAKNKPDKNRLSTSALRVAAAIESLHAYSLIHDDLPAMDNAAMRRGKPACHVAFGEAVAILAGDALQSLAFEILAHPDTEPAPDTPCAPRIIHEVSRAIGIAGMAGGQALDITAEKGGFDRTATETMQAMKTGALITAACRMGGILGAANKELLTALTTYGANIGAAFQITDDLMDASGDSVRAGKPLGRDAAAGKASLITHIGAEQAQAEAERLIASARTALTNTAPPSPGLDYLLTLAGFVITRDR